MIKQQVLMYSSKDCVDCKGTGLISVQITRPSYITENYKYLCDCVESRFIMPPQGDPGAPE